MQRNRETEFQRTEIQSGNAPLSLCNFATLQLCRYAAMPLCTYRRSFTSTGMFAKPVSFETWSMTPTEILPGPGSMMSSMEYV